MSRSFILRATIIVILILLGVWLARQLYPGFVPDTPNPSDILIERITSTGIISPDLVDLSTAKGWPEDGSQPYEFIGATTLGSPPNLPNVIGVLYISENSDQTYPPGTYLVQVRDFKQQEPSFQRQAPSVQQQESSILLIDQDGNEFIALDGEAESYKSRGVETGKNHFFFSEGSVRCEYCPWWLSGIYDGICWCITCRQ